MRQEFLLVIAGEDGLGVGAAFVEEQGSEVLGLSVAVTGSPLGLVERITALVHDLRGFVSRFEITGGPFGGNAADTLAEVFFVDGIVLGDRTGIEHGARLESCRGIAGGTAGSVLVGQAGDGRIEILSDKVPALLFGGTGSPRILQRRVGRIIDHVIDLRNTAQPLDHCEVHIGADEIGLAQDRIVIAVRKSAFVFRKPLDKQVDFADRFVSGVPHVAAGFGEESLRVASYGFAGGAAHLAVHGARIAEAVFETIPEILHGQDAVQACEVTRRTLDVAEDILFVKNIFRRYIQIGARGECARTKNQEIIFQTFHFFCFFRI